MPIPGAILTLLLALLPAVAPAQAEPQRSAVKHAPMIFFVAKGAPDACGPGCDSWIGAEGTFDPQVHTRLRDFLAPEARRRLPIFFHSPGGELQPSVAVGHVLREFRMTAGVGQTLPEGCSEGPRANAACRKLMQSGRELKARLRVARGICASGCAYALVGASTRLIGEGARLGVHASRVVVRPQRARGGQRDPAQDLARAGAPALRAAESQSYDILRHYVTIAGVDPALIDLAMRTPHRTVHWLTRDELTRFGLITGEVFETRWLRHEKADGGVFIIKSVTQPAPSRRGDYRTVNIGIDCSASQRAYVTLRRELPGDGTPPTLKLAAGEAFVMIFGAGRKQGTSVDLHVQPLSADALARLAAGETMQLREERESWSRETKLSTHGLQDALATAPGRCGRRV